MNEEKQKKIRTQLINFINQELLYNKKNKNSDFLINSMTLEQLEKKNMQCKDFYIEEKNQTYQNIDNGWIMGLNIYINNLSNNNSYMYSLSNFIKDDVIIKDIKNVNKININTYNDHNKETIIQKKSNKVLYIQKEGNMGSPVDTTLLIKKELGERKLKRTNKEFNSNKMPISHTNRFFNENSIDNELKEKENENNNINNVNDDEENSKITKKYSNETLETEISRIIKICHDERYTNSFDHYPSDSKISGLSKEIKIAKMYAKKLKFYCRTLKRKFAINNDNNKISKKNLEINNYINEEIQNKKNENNIKKDINFIKVKNDKNINKKMSSYGHFNKIKNNEENKENINYRQIIPHKKNKSEKNIKLKIKRNSHFKNIKDNENDNKNNNMTISSNVNNNNNQYKTLEEKNNKKRISIVKINKKKKRKTLIEDKSKTKIKIKKELIKASPKIIKIRSRNNKLIKVHKTMNDIYLLVDSPKLSITNLIKKKKKKENIEERNKNITEVNKESNLKKVIKVRKTFEERHKKEKSTNIKKGSIDAKTNLSGFEKLNFLKSKNKSTSDQFFFSKKRKKKKINNLNNVNYNTTFSQQIDSSPSVSIHKKFIRKNNKKKNNTLISHNNRDEKKKKTFGFLKTKRASVILEALKKMKKRKSTNYNEKVGDNKKRLSPIKNDNFKINNTNIDGNKKTKINSKKIIKFDESKQFNSEEIKETDIFNIMDELLYKKKHERSKKCNLFTVG